MTSAAGVTRGAMHLHTCRSFDSLTRPKRLIAEAVRLGLDFIAVCDHDDLAGALAVREEARRTEAARRLAVLVGAEYRSDDGDLVCLGIERPIATRRPAELVKETHAQGGLVVLPHPYRGHLHVERLAAEVDLIETVNARCTPAANAAAAALAARHGKPAVGGSDAHLACQMGHCLVEFDGRWDLSDGGRVRAMLLTGRRRIRLRRAWDPMARVFCQAASLLRVGGLILRIRKGIFLMRGARD
jgi:predicted metal-dependent phosphoesterase TrpH